MILQRILFKQQIKKVFNLSQALFRDDLNCWKYYIRIDENKYPL